VGQGGDCSPHFEGERNALAGNRKRNATATAPRCPHTSRGGNAPLQVVTERLCAAFGRAVWEAEWSFGKAASSRPFLRQGKPHSIERQKARGACERCGLLSL
jgi:hypothetical protein